MAIAFQQQCLGFFSPSLIQDYFQEDVGIEQESHFSSVLHPDILCWSSTEEYSSPISFRTPPQLKPGFPAAFFTFFSLRNSTKSSTSFWSSGGNSSIFLA